MKKIKITGIALLIVGLLLMAVALIKEIVILPLAFAGLIIACSGFIYLFIFWRCPYCHTHLPFHGMIGIDHCPYCGNKLD